MKWPKWSKCGRYLLYGEPTSESDCAVHLVEFDAEKKSFTNFNLNSTYTARKADIGVPTDKVYRVELVLLSDTELKWIIVNIDTRTLIELTNFTDIFKLQRRCER